MPTSAGPGIGSGRRAVFIDKDGTLVQDVPYNVDPALLRFTPNATEALRDLSAAGFLLVVVSNQPGVAQGRFELAALRLLASALTDRLAAAGVVLSGFYACPHLPRASGARPSDGCDCRKPAPGLLLEAATELSIDLGESWMIGDILDDVEAGRRAGCRTIHLDVGNETVWLRSPMRQPTATVPHLLAAAEFILGARPPVPLTQGLCSDSRTLADGQLGETSTAQRVRGSRQRSAASTAWQRSQCSWRR